ncbi:Kinetochore protein Spc24 [Emydomyces testavorans]|uniref:Kinetochore protein Spc24 n=1 Tax=Emydomyces testavorans TaxID=2070801 RepID=A0AAF0IG69_9EURO|nr:Kinetochore protein Spc24 [Emydomyces testavorans]
MEPPTKKQKKLLLSDGSDDESTTEGGLKLHDGEIFKINEEYARRFEHNKKLEELQQLEEKLGNSKTSGKRQSARKTEDENDETELSESETEDDEAALVTEAVDSEIGAIIQAIRNKDPRVYSKDAVFFSNLDEGVVSTRQKEQKPMYLRDYHRENLLRGANGADDEEDTPKTYVQEQEELKRTIVKEMHAAVDSDEGEADDTSDDDDGFLIRKSKREITPSERKQITEEDVAEADKDPETFLSNFMASRAWVPTARSNFQPFESDDDEEEAKAEEFEKAYNLRFEDPNKLNEALVTHARDTTSKFSVRREEPSSRKRKREAERLKKEEEKKQRDAERARLRKLKLEQLQEKVARIKKAAGLRASDITDEDWACFLEEGWDDNKWEEEMANRFGEKYYAEGELADSDENGNAASSVRRPKKPTWDDDIDIKDIIPDFEDEEKVEFGLSDLDENADEKYDAEGQKGKKIKKVQDKKEKQKEAKRERRRIEQIVDQNLNLETALLPGSSKKFSGAFRYREASPVSFGLTARDILMADDSQLNQFAGLKKLASFRLQDKKKRDHKKLGKKARLRQWRKDTFGDENGPPMTLPEPEVKTRKGAPDALGSDTEVKIDIREGGKKRRKRPKQH